MANLKEALLYDKKDNLLVSCKLCSHRCLITEGGFGVCAVRQNIGGELFTHSYGRVVAAHVDPIEKKPIFHMLPGTRSYSFATLGCNFRCGFCQNWQISQAKEAKGNAEESEIDPEHLIREVKAYRCPSIAYTYTEPTIFFEFALDVMKLAKAENIRNVFVTNGYMTAECLELAKGYLDAANVDLKSFRDEFYKEICQATLKPVLDSIKLMRKLNIWVEITTLVIPGLNDSKEELKDIAQFIYSVDKVTPWHVSRFHPDYKITDRQPTPTEKLKEAFEIGKAEGLRYVYIGNTAAEENTHCYNCNEVLIRRKGFSLLENKLKESKCPKCNSVIDGVNL